jgi:hypothetical protein
MLTPRACLLWLLACSALLCSCDVDLFGWKKVAGGYYLDEWHKGYDGYILFPPDGGSAESPEIRVQQIGWKKPFIIVHPDSEADEWIIIDTQTHQRTSISDAQRLADQNYRNIAVYSAEAAWRRLRRSKQW